MSLQTRAVHLLTTPDRVEIFVRGERFATYRYAEGLMPGFVSLAAPGERLITQPNADGLGLWIAHGEKTHEEGPAGKAKVESERNAIVNRQSSIRASTGSPEGHNPQSTIITEDMTARRGPYSVGFQHNCAWLDGEGERILTDTRTLRAAPGPAEGAVLDIHLRLQAPDTSTVHFGASGEALLCLQVASALFRTEPDGIGGGQIRNSLGEYGMANLHSRIAGWCGGIGVVRGETIGFALLEHPDNPWFPSPWVARPDGLLSPAPFAWRSFKLPPGGHVSLRYRLLVHVGYVDQGWADDRLADFAREVGSD